MDVAAVVPTVDMDVAAVVPTPSAAQAGSSRFAVEEEKSKLQGANQQHLCYCPAL
jgi:hypothetical protein